jgi:hypothetical protein
MTISCGSASGTKPSRGNSTEFAHAIREEEKDLSFADFEVCDGSERLYPIQSSALHDTPSLTAVGFGDTVSASPTPQDPGCVPALRLFFRGVDIFFKAFLFTYILIE